MLCCALLRRSLPIVVFDISHSLVYVSQPMSRQCDNLQSVIFQSCKFSYVPSVPLVIHT